MNLARCLAVLGVLACCAALPAGAQGRKYDVKSGIITFETLTTEGRITTAGQIVLYFDDYGKKECKDTYVGGMLRESVLSDGRNSYTVWHDKRIVFKRGPSSGGTEIRFDWEGIPVNRRVTLKKLPDLDIAQHPCEMYEQSRGNSTVRLAGWNHILLYREDTRSGGSWSLKAVKVEQPSVIPGGKFLPPPTYEEKSTLF